MSSNTESVAGRRAKERLKEALLKDGASPEYAEQKAVEAAKRHSRRKDK